MACRQQTGRADTVSDNIITRLEAFFASYISFPYENHALVAAVWAAHTHLWPHFDATPYMVVTAETKQSGKTLFGIDLMDMVAANPAKLTGMTPAAAFRKIDADKPTCLVDEAETLDSESATDLRAALNAGYKAGAQFIRAAEGKRGTITFNVFCPKLFVLIGDVNDTLHDRSVIMRLARGKPGKRFFRRHAETEGHSIRDDLAALCSTAGVAVAAQYEQMASATGLDFLSSRDEEIWLPLFATCALLAPDLMKRLTRAAVDLCADKTAQRRSYVVLLQDGVEDKARDDEYARRLLADLLSVMNHTGATLRAYKGRKGGRYVLTVEAIPKLFDLDTAPWRRYRGRGLTDTDMGHMLDRFGVHPRSIKVSPGKVQRGYREEDVADALKRLDQ